MLSKRLQCCKHRLSGYRYECQNLIPYQERTHVRTEKSTIWNCIKNIWNQIKSCVQSMSSQCLYKTTWKMVWWPRTCTVEHFLCLDIVKHIWTLRWSRLRTSTKNLLYWSLSIVVGHVCWECFECINGVVMCCLSMHITPNSSRRKQHATSKPTEDLSTNLPIQSCLDI